MAYLLDPPGLDEDVAGIWQDVRYARGRLAAGLGAGDVRLRRAAAIARSAGRKSGSRSGVLDAVFIGEPGVLEARQRIALRMRAAKRA